MLKINRRTLTEVRAEDVRSLYDKYAGMMLGYITGVVKDERLAEEYLVELFSDLSNQFNEINWDGTNSWCELQRFAKNKLSTMTDKPTSIAPSVAGGLVISSSKDRYFEKMTDEQRQIFDAVYYQGKEIATLSKELNKTEDLIRKTLKETFAILRKSGKN